MEFEDLLKSAKTPKIVTPAEDKQKQRKHEEANLHLEFCSFIKKEYPSLDFIRNERERARSKFSGQLMGKYNSLGGIPDFELIDGIGVFNGLYIEFKKPGESWLNKHGQVKPDYAHQYAFHLKAWSKRRPAYFCNDIDAAKNILRMYIMQSPLPPQQYQFTDEDKKKYLVDKEVF